jgi:hypothetical protein
MNAICARITARRLVLPSRRGVEDLAGARGYSFPPVVRAHHFNGTRCNAPTTDPTNARAAKIAATSAVFRARAALAVSDSDVCRTASMVALLLLSRTWNATFESALPVPKILSARLRPRPPLQRRPGASSRRARTRAPRAVAPRCVPLRVGAARCHEPILQRGDPQWEGERAGTTACGVSVG